jgi:hypothetical protein
MSVNLQAFLLKVKKDKRKGSLQAYESYKHELQRLELPQKEYDETIRCVIKVLKV